MDWLWDGVPALVVWLWPQGWAGIAVVAFALWLRSIGLGNSPPRR